MKRMKQLLLDIQPLALPSLDNFVLGKNAEALHSIQEALSPALNKDSHHRFIYLWGASGSGKTHLVQAAKALADLNQIALVFADDVHTFNEQQQIDLFNQYNELRAGQGVLIATGNASPSQMGLREDLATRLAWGLTYQLHPLTDEEKAKALKSHAFARGMNLPDEVVDYCLRYLRRDLPSLMATLDALDEWSLTEKKPITVPLLKKLLQLPLNL
jgi:DnaA family protein